ncbi:putative DsbA family dithiol-disulfide isomerase [Paenibacillus phyllosphaerae]|uniref:Putative DsbA family dithiol-disulfide isomerase n=1 Tax=Paenibacillus phyllosphaerae TaxID=274593 RepID=A0A7W5FN12_9BACL|nr:DsbA family oxidoreductase [Paenibacillus phyllosphaerae]MBB3110815.1 putative DsbA family dithiol-disulfide isomerase [Paenibacillus phyllosphaerae]
MQVEVWSDVACPFCYIGKRRFETALQEFAHNENVEVVYRSFELDPNAPKQVPYDAHDMLSKKYGMSRQEAINMNQNVTQQAAAEGVTFNIDDMKLTNTFDAHRLSHFADQYGKRTAVTELLFRAYFTDSVNVSDHETLANLAAEAGLDREAALAMLASDQFTAQVRSEEEEGSRLGIRGVPFYVINRKYAVSGAQPGGVFLNALGQAWEDQQPLKVVDSANDAACTDGSCGIGD